VDAIELDGIGTTECVFSLLCVDGSDFLELPEGTRVRLGHRTEWSLDDYANFCAGTTTDAQQRRQLSPISSVWTEHRRQARTFREGDFKGDTLKVEFDEKGQVKEGELEKYNGEELRLWFRSRQATSDFASIKAQQVRQVKRIMEMERLTGERRLVCRTGYSLSTLRRVVDTDVSVKKATQDPPDWWDHVEEDQWVSDDAKWEEYVPRLSLPSIEKFYTQSSVSTDSNAYGRGQDMAANLIDVPSLGVSRNGRYLYARCHMPADMKSVRYWVKLRLEVPKGDGVVKVTMNTYDAFCRCRGGALHCKHTCGLLLMVYTMGLPLARATTNGQAQWRKPRNTRLTEQYLPSQRLAVLNFNAPARKTRRKREKEQKSVHHAAPRKRRVSDIDQHGCPIHDKHLEDMRAYVNAKLGVQKRTAREWHAKSARLQRELKRRKTQGMVDPPSLPQPWKKHIELRCLSKT
jgi:hypothetical protein